MCVGCSAKAARATASAVGSNPIAFLIPCHPVIRAGGITGDYAGGATRKRCMLAWEASRQSIGAAEMEQAGGALRRVPFPPTKSTPARQQ